jgi:nicotinic acid mononucleotide adenylyltransferase
MKTIGIYISDFDPVSSAHIAFAKDAINSNDMSKLFFLVEPRPRSKQGVKAVDHRINMVILAVKNYANMGTIILRQPLPDPNELMSYLGKRFPEQMIKLVLPDDLVGKRNSLAWLKGLDKTINLTVGLSHYSEEEIKDQLKLIEQTSGHKIRFSTFKTINPAAATTRLRRELKTNQRPGEIAGSVYQYIQDNKLYLSDSRA